MEDEAAREVPELVSPLHLLVRANPDDVLEPRELAGPRRPPLDVDGPEPAEVDVHRMAPAAAVVAQRPLFVRVQFGKRVHPGRVPAPAVDREVAVAPVELEEAELRRRLCV